MESLQTIFCTMLKENKEDENITVVISKLTFELSKKRIQRLKDSVRIQNRLGELFEIYAKSLQDEELMSSKNIDAVISGLIKASSYDKEEFLYKSIYEKERLEKSIKEQKDSIKSTIIGTFNTLETHLKKLDEIVAKESLKSLHDTKLRGIELLGILKETTSEAFLTALEKAQEVESAIFEIAKSITYQTINEGNFSKNRLLEVANSVLEVAIEIAHEDHGNAKSLLNGSIHGSKEGITKAIEKFKNDIQFAAEEIEDILGKDLSTIKKELIGIEDDFVKLVKNSANSTDGISAQIITDILDTDLNSSSAKIKRALNEASETLGEKIDELKNSSYKDSKFIKKAEKKLGEFEEVASKKVGEIRSYEFENERVKKATKKAKKLGNRVWIVTKGAIKGAIKGAKEGMK